MNSKKKKKVDKKLYPSMNFHGPPKIKIQNYQNYQNQQTTQVTQVLETLPSKKAEVDANDFSLILKYVHAMY